MHFGLFCVFRGAGAIVPMDEGSLARKSEGDIVIYKDILTLLER